MSAKQIMFDDEGRRAMQKGIEKLGRTVRVTFDHKRPTNSSGISYRCSGILRECVVFSTNQ